MKKIFAVMLALIFLFSNGIAQPLVGVYSPVASVNPSTNSFNAGIIPSRLGFVTESWQGKPGRIVVIVQDLHCHPGAQRTIKEIIEHFNTRYSVGKIFIEGGSGKVDTSWVSCIQDEKLRRGFIETLVANGRLSGAEYYGMAHGYPDNLFGLEDKELHHTNLARLENIRENSEIGAILDGMNNELNRTEDLYLHGRLGRFVRALRSEVQQPMRYYQRLSNTARELGIDLAWYPNLAEYAGKEKEARRLNTRSVSKELSLLIPELRAKMPYKDYRSLLAATDNFQQLEGLAAQWDAIRSKYVSGDKYPRLERYLHLCDNRGLNPEELTIDEQLIKREIIWRLAQGESERRVALLRDYFNSFRRYWQANITPAEMRYVKDNRRSFMENWIQYVGNENYRQLDRYKEFVETYYRVNEERTVIFMENLGAKLPDTMPAAGKPVTPEQLLSSSKDVDMVVMGGFHAGDSAIKLREAGISHMVIMPRIEGDIAVAESNYRRIMDEQSINVALTSGRLDDQIKTMACYIGEAMFGQGATDDAVKVVIEECARRLLAHPKNKGKNKSAYIGKVSVTGNRHDGMYITRIAETMICKQADGGKWQVSIGEISSKSFQDRQETPDSPHVTTFGHNIIDVLDLSRAVPGLTELTDISTDWANMIRSLFEEKEYIVGKKEAQKLYGRAIQQIASSEGWGGTEIAITCSHKLVHRKAWCLAHQTEENGRRILYLHESLAWWFNEIDDDQLKTSVAWLLDHENREFNALYRPDSEEGKALCAFLGVLPGSTALNPDHYHQFIDAHPAQYSSDKALSKEGALAKSAWIIGRISTKGFSDAESRNRRAEKKEQFARVLERLREMSGSSDSERVNLVIKSGLPMGRYSNLKEMYMPRGYTPKDTVNEPQKALEIVRNLWMLESGSLALLVALGELDEKQARSFGRDDGKVRRELSVNEIRELAVYADEMVNSYANYRYDKKSQEPGLCLGFSYKGILKLAAIYGFDTEIVLSNMKFHPRDYLYYLRKKSEFSKRYRSIVTPDEMKKIFISDNFYEFRMNKIARQRLSKEDYEFLVMIRQIEEIPGAHEKMMIIEKEKIPLGGGAETSLEGKLQKPLAEVFERHGIMREKAGYIAGRLCKKGNRGLLAMLVATGEIDGVTACMLAFQYQFAWDKRDEETTRKLVSLARRLIEDYKDTDTDYKLRGMRLCLPQSAIQKIADAFGSGKYVVDNLIFRYSGKYLSILEKKNNWEKLYRHISGTVMNLEEFSAFVSRMMTCKSLSSKFQWIIDSRLPFGTDRSLVMQEKRKQELVEILNSCGFAAVNPEEKKTVESLAGKISQLHAASLAALVGLGDMDEHDALCIVSWELGEIRNKMAFAGRLYGTVRSYDHKEPYIKKLGLAQGISYDGIEKVAEAYGLKDKHMSLVFRVLQHQPGKWLEVVAGIGVLQAEGKLTQTDINELVRGGSYETLRDRAAVKLKGGKEVFKAESVIIDRVAGETTLAGRIAIIKEDGLLLGANRKLGSPAPCAKAIADILFSSGFRRGDTRDSDDVAVISERLSLLKPGLLALLVALDELTPEEAKLIISLRCGYSYRMKVKNKKEFAKKIKKTMESLDEKGALHREIGRNFVVGYDALQKLAHHYKLYDEHKTMLVCDAMKFAPNDFLNRLERVSKLYIKLKNESGRNKYTFGMLQQALRGSLEEKTFYSNLAKLRTKLRRTTTFGHNVGLVLQRVMGPGYGLSDFSSQMAGLLMEDAIDAQAVDEPLREMAEMTQNISKEIFPPEKSLKQVYFTPGQKFIYSDAWWLAAIVFDEDGNGTLYMHESLARRISKMNRRKQGLVIRAILRHEIREHDALYDPESPEYKPLREYFRKENGLTRDNYHEFLANGVSPFGRAYKAEQNDLKKEGQFVADLWLKKYGVDSIAVARDCAKKACSIQGIIVKVAGIAGGLVHRRLVVAVVPDINPETNEMLFDMKNSRQSVLPITPVDGIKYGVFLCALPCSLRGSDPIMVRVCKGIVKKGNSKRMPALFIDVSAGGTVFSESDKEEIFRQASRELWNRMARGNDPVIWERLSDVFSGISEFELVGQAPLLAQGGDETGRNLYGISRPHAGVAALCDLAIDGKLADTRTIEAFFRFYKKHGIDAVVLRSPVKDYIPHAGRHNRSIVNLSKVLLGKAHKEKLTVLNEFDCEKKQYDTPEKVISDVEEYFRAGFDGFIFNAQHYEDIPDSWFDDINILYRRFRSEQPPIIALDAAKPELAQKARLHGFLVVLNAVPGDNLQKVSPEDCVIINPPEGHVVERSTMEQSLAGIEAANPGYVVISDTILLGCLPEGRSATLTRLFDAWVKLQEVIMHRGNASMLRDLAGIKYEEGSGMGKTMCPDKFIRSKTAGVLVKFILESERGGAIKASGHGIMAFAGLMRRLRQDPASAREWLEGLPETEDIFGKLFNALDQSFGLSEKEWPVGWSKLNGLKIVYLHENESVKKAAILLTALDMVYGLCAQRLESRYGTKGNGVFRMDAASMKTIDELLFMADASGCAMVDQPLLEDAQEYLKGYNLNVLADYLSGRKNNVPLPELRAALIVELEKAIQPSAAPWQLEGEARRNWVVSAMARSLGLFLDPLTDWEKMRIIGGAVTDALGTEAILRAS